MATDRAVAPEAPFVRGCEIALLVGAVGALVLPPFGGDASEIALALAVLAWIARGIAGGGWSVPALPLAVLFGVFAADWIGSALWSADAPSSWHVVQYYPLRMAAFLVGAALVRRERNLEVLAWAIVVVVAYCLLDGVLQASTGATLLKGRELDHGRVRINFTHPNDVILLAVLAPLASAWLAGRPGWGGEILRRAAAVFTALAAMVLVVLSGSKTGLLAVAGGLALALLATVRLRWLIAGAVGLVALVGTSYALNLGHLQQRLDSATHPPYDARLVVWSVGVELWKQDPVLGRGTGTYASAYEDTLSGLEIPETWEIYKDPIEHPHGIFMAALVEHGLIGFVLLLLLFAVAGWKLVLAKRSGPDWARWASVGVATAVAVLAVTGVTEFWFGRRWVLVFFALLLGMAGGLARVARLGRR